MSSFVYRSVVLVAILELTSANPTKCETSQNHFAKLCFSPTPALEVDYNWLVENQPSEGWYANTGNDVQQFHLSEIIKKEVLNRDDDFSDMCLRIHIDHTTGDGTLTGYGGMVSKWVCNNSMDFPGAQRCDVQTDHSKYHEDVLGYLSLQDEKTKIAVSVNCFPNGQVGWSVYSKHPTLTDEEREIVISHAEKLGFPKDTNEVLYGDKCPK